MPDLSAPAHRVHRRPLPAALALAAALFAPTPAAAQSPPIYVTFLWHMHQPRYWPGESVVETARARRFSFDPLTVHRDRTGPYTTWARDAVDQARAAGLGACGAQVSFTGSLMENLDAMRDAGDGFADWTAPWRAGRAMLTERGNPRLDLVDFGFFHPLMPLNDPRDNELQIRLFREFRDAHFGGAASRGIFTPENAFHPRLVPTLSSLGVQWALVDNVHFDRARVDLPYSAGSNLYPPNRADQRNGARPGAWVQLNGIWAPSRVSAPWGYQPHWVSHTDPATGAVSRIIAVPAARYEGNEDARGGFGALQYETVLSQYAAQNTDPRHPMLVVLHHDGDNYGGGSDSYYHGNFGQFVRWAAANPGRFVCTTVQDYLDRFPPDEGDVIHVEPGSWAGADNGDPEFLKWNADPDARTGVSPDRSSWAAVVGARNWVHTAERQRPVASLANVRGNTGSATERAWRALLEAEASDYWYWDNSEGGTWDSLPTRACNTAVARAQEVVDANRDDLGPSLHPPQRDPYNPGAIEWGATVQPSNFTVWTLAYDLSGIRRVTLRWRRDDDGRVDPADERHAGAFTDLAMTGAELPVPNGVPTATARARQWSGAVTGVSEAMVHYFVEAEDSRGNVSRTDLGHVYVGRAAAPADAGTPPPWDAGPVVPDDRPTVSDDRGGMSDDRPTVSDDRGGMSDGGVSPRPELSHAPAAPTRCDAITVRSARPGALHWGINGWTLPPASLRPAGSVAWSDGMAVETPLARVSDGEYAVRLGPFGEGASVSALDYVVHYADDRWSAPDQHVAISPCAPDAGAMDVPSEDVPPAATPAPAATGCGCAAGASPRVSSLGLLALALLPRRRRRPRG